MNGYTNAPVCEGAPTPKEPGTVKDIMLETTAVLGRVSHTLDVVWSFVTEPGMDMDKPPRNPEDCLIATVVSANEIANELMAKAERLCKVLGV